jgi:hypothetical protein
MQENKLLESNILLPKEWFNVVTYFEIKVVHKCYPLYVHTNYILT